MTKIEKFKFVLKASIQNKSMFLGLKIAFVAIAFYRLYSLTNNVLYSILLIIAIFLPAVLLVSLLIATGSNEYFVKYQKAINSGQTVPTSKKVVFFALIYAFIVVVLIIKLV